MSVCHRCERHDAENRRNGGVFLLSAENDMDPGEVDAALPVLTQTEEMLIARVHVYGPVRNPVYSADFALARVTF